MIAKMKVKAKQKQLKEKPEDAKKGIEPQLAPEDAALLQDKFVDIEAHPFFKVQTKFVKEKLKNQGMPEGQHFDYDKMPHHEESKPVTDPGGWPKWKNETLDGHFKEWIKKNEKEKEDEKAKQDKERPPFKGYRPKGHRLHSIWEIHPSEKEELK